MIVKDYISINHNVTPFHGYNMVGVFCNCISAYNKKYNKLFQ